MGWTAIRESLDFLRRPAEGRTEVLGTRRAALAFPQPGRCSAELALTLDHVTRQPDRVALLTEGPADGLANPPVGIGDKFQAALRLKLVYRA